VGTESAETTDNAVVRNESAAEASAPSPITITQGPNGLIVSSQDQEALDQIMDLLDELAPTEMSYRVFELKNTYAKDVAKLL
jgi:hypothetical protein